MQQKQNIKIEIVIYATEKNLKKYIIILSKIKVQDKNVYKNKMKLKNKTYNKNTCKKQMKGINI